MDEVLYRGFGGYSVEMNGKIMYLASPEMDWAQFATLEDIEAMAQHEPDEEWVVVLDNPLRGARWKRENGRWVLFETNPGFA